MKTATVPADALRSDLSLLPSHYIQSDIDKMTEMWKARCPGKTVRVHRRPNGFTVTVTETFHTDPNGERVK
jgi:hypothetical protein